MRTSFLAGKQTIRLALAGVLLAAGAVPAVAAPPATTSLIMTIKAPALPRSAAPSGALDATGYWTAEKMQNAIPADLSAVPGSSKQTAQPGSSGIASRPVAPKTQPGRTTVLNDVVPTTAGKLFFTDNGLNYVCSASTINNNYKNLIITAGHCVHSGQGGAWHSNIVFAPAYYNGASGSGLWNWTGARAFNSWINSSDFTHDQAFVTLGQRNGRNLIDAVGGNGLVWGNSPDQPNTRIWAGRPSRPTTARCLTTATAAPTAGTAAATLPSAAP
jgi:hypothetical protein